MGPGALASSSSPAFSRAPVLQGEWVWTSSFPWAGPLAEKQRLRDLCTVGVRLYHLAVHGHSEGEAQNLWRQEVTGLCPQAETLVYAQC